MEIEIMVFKESGKYYTNEIVKSEIDIPLFAEEFKQFVRDNIPADLGTGFIVINDVSNNQTFHITLYRYAELFNK